MKLVDGENGGRRIIDRLGQGLDGDIDDDAERKRRILLDRAFGPKCDRSQKSPLVDRPGAAMHQKKRFACGDEIPDAGDEFDDAIDALCLGHQRLQFHGK